MNVFTSILSEITKRLSLDSEKSKEIATILSQESKLLITEHDFTIKKGRIILALSPTAKMAILIKKETILTVCKDRGITIYTIS